MFCFVLHPEMDILFSFLVVQKFIPGRSVTDLMRWGKKHYGYLFEPHTIPKSQSTRVCDDAYRELTIHCGLGEVKFRISRELMGDLVIHCRAILLHLVSPRGTNIRRLWV